MKDELGNRMKEQYENRTRVYLPRRTYTVVRVDGKAFHTYTKMADKPFDETLMMAMQATAIGMCERIQGAKFAYTQSDEISVLLTDFEKPQTDAWFDGNVQKIASISASIATMVFNQFMQKEVVKGFSSDAMFDARVFTIPDPVEVENYFIWRQQDSTRNSISMAAQTVYSHKELHGKNTSDMQEMLFQKGINWNDYTPNEKRGTVIRRVSYTFEGTQRNRWEADSNTPIFTQDRGYMRGIIPIVETW